MELGFLVFRQTLLMFLLMAAGYILYKKNLVTDAGSRDLGCMLVNLSIPAVVLKSFLTEYTEEKTSGLIMSMVLSLAALLLSMAVCGVLYGKRKRLENCGNCFSNCGFMGIPMVSAVLGDGAVFYISSYVAMLNILQQTYGIYVLTGKTDSIRPGKLVRIPVLLSFLVGILVYFLRIPVPSIITEAVGYAAGLNTPVAMISLGIYLAQSRLAEVFTEKALYLLSAVRLVLVPLLTIIMLSLCPALSYIRMIVLIAASAPIGSNVAIFAKLYGMDQARAARMVCNSTVLSIISMPIVVSAASVLWQLGI